MDHRSVEMISQNSRRMSFVFPLCDCVVPVCVFKTSIVDRSVRERGGIRTVCCQPQSRTSQATDLRRHCAICLPPTWLNLTQPLAEQHCFQEGIRVVLFRFRFSVFSVHSSVSTWFRSQLSVKRVLIFCFSFFVFSVYSSLFFNLIPVTIEWNLYK